MAAAFPQSFPDLFPHGHYRRYNAGCRCDPCKAAHAARRRETYQPRAVPVLGSQRRVLALASVGWTWVRIGAEAGLSAESVREIAVAQRPHVWRATADKLAAAFERMGAWPRPELTLDSPEVMHAAHARALGGVPPLCWDDDALDDPDGQPDHSAALGWERFLGLGDPHVELEDLEEMAHHGASVEEAAERLGVKFKSVYTACYRAERPDIYKALLRNSGRVDSWTFTPDVAV